MDCFVKIRNTQLFHNIKVHKQSTILVVSLIMKVFQRMATICLLIRVDLLMQVTNF